MFPHFCGHFSRKCGVFRDIFFRSVSSSMFCAQNQDVSPPPRPFLPELWRFPGHFPLRRQFLHVLRPKPGCFPIATSFPPCFVALFGTFFFAEVVSPCFTPKTRMFSHRHTISSMFYGVFQDIFFRGGSFSMFCAQNQDVSLPPHNFLHVLWRFPGHSSSAASVSPCFTPKTRMFSHCHFISSMFCGVFRDIFLCGSIFSMFYPKNLDVSPPPHNFLHVLQCFPGHFLPRQHFLPEMWSFPGYFLSPL